MAFLRKTKISISAFLVLLCLLLATMQAAPARCVSFVFNGFDSNNMSLSGIAEMDRRLIRLTNTSSRLFGRAFFPSPVLIKDPSTKGVSSFSSAFVFCMTPLLPTLGGHGMAFVMSPSLDSSHVFPSQYLGILNASDNGNSSDHVFAVEFDTVQDLEFQDINDNHVGINLNSMVSTNSTTAGYWSEPQNSSQEAAAAKTVLTLKNGDIIQAWIDYDGHEQQLNVTISPVASPRPRIPLLSVNVNLSGVLDEYMYVGFSASTGVIAGTHRVLSWSFNSNGAAKSLDLSKLPSIVPKIPTVETARFKILVSSLVIALILILTSAVGLLLYKRSQKEILESWELEFGLHRYSYKELVDATRKFHEKELLGVGGFGQVYRGILPKSGLEVAVKRLSRGSDQGEREFIAEMASIGRLRHQNLVQVLGWSRRKGELLLVYDYMSNGSLDRLLFDRSTQVLRWEQRKKIVRGIAAGMYYLHEGWEQQILHRDIKASNVLLDAEMNAKLGDFGLARLYEHGQNPHTTRVVGTLGYLAPEFARTGKATTSTDVYSFGALLLEVVTGRRPLEHRGGMEKEFLLVEAVLGLYRNGRLVEAVDKKLDGLFDVEEAETMLVLGLLCSHPEPASRPGMGQVVEILNNEGTLPPLPPFHSDSLSQDRLKDDGELVSFSSSSVKSWNRFDQSNQISGR